MNSMLRFILTSFIEAIGLQTPQLQGPVSFAVEELVLNSLITSNLLYYNKFKVIQNVFGTIEVDSYFTKFFS